MLRKGFLALMTLLAAACAQAPVVEQVAEKVLPPAAETPKGVTLPPFETFTLENGMQVLLMEKHDVPLVSFHASIRGGALADPRGKEGVASLVAELLRKGAGRRNAQQFAEAVENVGGDVSTAAGQEQLLVSAEFLSRDAALAVELLGDMLTDPALSPGEFEKLRERSAQQLAAMKDMNLRALTGVYGHAWLFGDHPYARPAFGSEAGLAAIGYADLRRYFIEQVGADRTILAVVGDFEAAEMRGLLEKRFGNWRRAAKPAPAVQPPAPVSGRRVLLVDKPDATQTYFFIGNVGVAQGDPDKAALDLVNTVFGGRFTSMLNTALRVESGLTYGAGSRLALYSQPGSVAITSFTRNETTGEAIDLALNVLERLHAEGLTEEQLASARSYVLGQFPPRLETNAALAAQLAELSFHGLGREWIDGYAERAGQVGVEEARAVIQRVYPRGEDLVFVLIGKAEEIRETAAKYGPVTEMKITHKRFRPGR